MNKIVPALALAALFAIATTGCGQASSEPSESAPGSSAMTPEASGSADTATGKLTETDGKLTDSDPQAAVIEGAGLSVEIDQTAKTAVFQAIDPATGDPFQDSLTYDFAAGTFVRKHFVSAMGATFLYNAEPNTGELLSVTNDAGEDAGEALRQRGRWDTAAAETMAIKTALDAWFLQRYGKTVAEVIGS
ncbi:hypothetical protein HMPREF1531_00442 [Propionibacterium sp. oral taxon 192 str. F0372]|uniref:hypothetical protein n=1 Tax=Propionibacterium sp. oral taxon 192 TaxID=671222 RepID=UPI0003532474|nr:hypothetical protein [Propionibacterium sp. oral taxon 192]EPH06840.1 hypothetical protein HMPREF1531_00442 [Propionibacterium sp. oral taxon 192 str. F0372]